MDVVSFLQAASPEPPALPRSQNRGRRFVAKHEASGVSRQKEALVWVERSTQARVLLPRLGLTPCSCRRFAARSPTPAHRESIARRAPVAATLSLDRSAAYLRGPAAART